MISSLISGRFEKLLARLVKEFLLLPREA